MAYIPLDSCNRSKVTNALFGIGANKRLFNKYGILTLAILPGVIPTELGRHFPDETLKQSRTCDKIRSSHIKVLLLDHLLRWLPLSTLS